MYPPTRSQVLRDKYDKISKVFHTSIDSPQKNLRYTTSFMFQLRVVFARTILLKMRDKQGLIIETVQAVVKAVILGIAFLGIGSQQPNFQLSFIFLLCQMSVISLLQVSKPSHPHHHDAWCHASVTFSPWTGHCNPYSCLVAARDQYRIWARSSKGALS